VELPVLLGPTRGRATGRPRQAANPAETRPLLELVLAAAASLAFALSFGLNFGVGNQVSYLTPSLRLLDPTLLERDWFATSTTQYHPVFAELGARLLALDPRGWAVAAAFLVVVTAAALALYALLLALAGPRGALASLFGVLALAIVTRTQGPMLTYVFEGTLQPSTLASAFVVGAAACFARGRFGWSGALLGASGACHLNLLVLLTPAFALAQLALGRAGLGRRLAAQLAGPALAAALLSPLLALAAQPVPDASFARHVYVAIRAPHHFALAGRLGSFLPFCAWQLLAAALLVPLARSGRHPAFTRVGALLAGLLAVAWAGTLGALATERLVPLFAWRIVPHAELLLQSALAALAVRQALEPALWDELGARPRLYAKLAFVALVAAYVLRADARPAVELTLVVLGLVGCRALSRGDVRPSWLVVAFVALFANFAAGPLERVQAHSSLLTRPRDARRELETWMRERSPKQALFLIPPDEETLRFWGERAIVVDWKGVPGLPAEVLAWYRRMGDVLGERDVKSEADVARYAELDPPRLEALRRRYDFDFAVVRRAVASKFERYERAYENSAFVVLAAPSQRPAAPREGRTPLRAPP
jgi:hypothetical protein